MTESSSTLTILFEQMFLLVNRLKGATVLVPSGNHTATLAGTGLSSAITLKGSDIVITADGVDMVDKPTLRPGARYLPFLDYVFKGRVIPKPISKAAVVPPNLHARVFLSDGFLAELPASKSEYQEVMWQFKREDGEVTLTQALTDQLLFTLPLDPAVKYALVIRTGETEQVIPIPADGADFVLLNTDIPRSDGKGKAGGEKSTDGATYTLREYALLYNLTSADTIVTLYPYPTAQIAGLGSSTEPICGGGQTDDDEDPPPPPPPV